MDFMKHDEAGNCISDGIKEAEEIITNAGGKIEGNGHICFPQQLYQLNIYNQDLIDAVAYLCDEWDYDYKVIS